MKRASPASDSVAELGKLLADTKECDASTLDLKRVRNAMKRARSTIQTMQRFEHDIKVRSGVERSLASSEMRADLIDREANAARREERQRVLFERAHSQSGQDSNERALTSARYVEAALASLCPHFPNRPNGGCDLLNEHILSANS